MQRTIGLVRSRPSGIVFGSFQQLEKTISRIHGKHGVTLNGRPQVALTAED